MTHVQAHVGEHVAAVLRQNPKPNFNPDRYADDIPLIWPEGDASKEVFDFEYDDPAGNIHFPHARLIWMKQYAGVVTAITISGTLQKTTLPKVYGEFTQAVDELRKAGWVAKYQIPSLEQVEAEAGKTDRSNGAMGLTSFVKDGTDASLEVQSRGEQISVSSRDRDAFILNVSFKNQSLDEEQGKKAYFERMRVKGNVNDFLSLSYWLGKQP